MGLSREYLINKLTEPFVQAYHSYQVDLAIMFDAERSRAESEMREALEFEFELAEVRNLDFLYFLKFLMKLFMSFQNESF